MSGGNIAYNLRPNKFIERSLFTESIGIICDGNIKNYAYMGMGGPQLQDHVKLHYQYGFEHLVSIESNKRIFERQLFNARPACIKCHNIDSEEFIDRFDDFKEKYSDQNYVIWLDYADSHQRYTQLSEFKSLTSQLGINDVIKITLNANLLTLGELKSIDESEEELLERRLEKISSQLGEFKPSGLTLDDISNGEKFASLLFRAIERAANKGIKSIRATDKIVVSKFLYSDGFHPMVTYCIKLIRKGEAMKEIEALKTRWPFATENEYDFHEINVPNMTDKERIHVERKFLPSESK
jgi:hypothetical protein